MKKTILKITAAAAFALLMVFNVTTTMNSTNFSLGGLKALALQTTGGFGNECTYVHMNTQKRWKIDPAKGCYEKTVTETETNEVGGTVGGSGQVVEGELGGTRTTTTTTSITTRECKYRKYDPHDLHPDQATTRIFAYDAIDDC